MKLQGTSNFAVFTIFEGASLRMEFLGTGGHLESILNRVKDKMGKLHLVNSVLF